jgi:hypothetical protein
MTSARKIRRLLVALGAVAASAFSTPVAASALFDRSQELVEALNLTQVETISALLSKGGMEKANVAAFIAECQSVLGARIHRISLPTSGTSTFAFFLAYTESGVWDMALELDEQDRVLFWAIADSLLEPKVSCSIHSRTQP